VRALAQRFGLTLGIVKAIGYGVDVLSVHGRNIGVGNVSPFAERAARRSRPDLKDANVTGEGDVSKFDVHRRLP
jgi:hypothetical protein